MANINVLNQNGEVVSNVELNDSVWAIEPNQQAMFDAVMVYRNSTRQATAKTKTRSEVRGGGKKPYRQKGTGSARQGSTRAPQWTKGGVVFAPKSRDFSKKMNVTAKRVALFSALSKKIADEQLFVIDNLAVENGKTKEMVAFLDAFKFSKTVLMVMGNDDVKVIRAAANIPTLETISVDTLSTYEVVKNAVVVIAKSAVEKLEEVYGE